MAPPQDEGDPFSDLRQSLDDDEPFFPSAKSGSAPAATAGGGPPARAAARPPPLPAQARPAAGGRTGAFPPAGPAPVAASSLSLPPTVVRPEGGDPFQEPLEPRPPRGGGPEEKLEFFRAVVKQKEETLARARSLYGAVDGEALELREVATQLKARLEEASQAKTRIVELEKQLQESDNDRKELTRALAEVEAQVPQLTQQLEAARDELNAANRKAMESQAFLQKEKQGRELAESKVGEAERRGRGFQEQVAQLEQAVAQLRDQLAASAQVPAPGADALAELDKLRADLVVMKKKLVQAEAAIEAAVSLKAKLARLEAQLKGK